VGKIIPVISVYPSDKIPEVYRHVDKGHKKGNAVIIMDDYLR
jgi:D-arabinose 1-dehydrogenase-like Zn-dependent alcohol dehydrogenase